MSAYVIAGRADDPSFARAELAAKQVEAIYPNVFFHFEMKHPDQWKEFINTVYRKYDFDGYPEDFPGPLVWTHEGELIGSTSEFVQRVCIEKFGMSTQRMFPEKRGVFEEIAAENLSQVKQQQHRQEHGPPFPELAAAACDAGLRDGLITPAVFAERRRKVVCGVSMELWISHRLEEEHVELRRAYGDGQPALVAADLMVCAVGPAIGPARLPSHHILAHPSPVVRQHLVLIPQASLREAAQPEAAAKTVAEPKDEEAAESATAPQPPGDAGETAVPAGEGAAAPALADAAEASATPDRKMMEVSPNGFRSAAAAPGTGAVDGLPLESFQAAFDVMATKEFGGVATWMGLRGASEYRHPLDTHLQVLPYPIHSMGEDCPYRYPLEPFAERSARDGTTSLKVFPFQHHFASLVDAPGDLAAVAHASYKEARQRFASNGAGHSHALAFTTSWLVVMPLMPPDHASPQHEAWLGMPPPPPCALCGIVVCPMVPRTFPETAGSTGCEDTLVSTRAALEGIPADCAEHEGAHREVRIATRLLDLPVEVMGVWAVPATASTA